MEEAGRRKNVSVRDRCRLLSFKDRRIQFGHLFIGTIQIEATWVEERKQKKVCKFEIGVIFSIFKVVEFSSDFAFHAP